MNLIKQLALGLTLATGASAASTFSDILVSPLAIPDHDANGILRALVVSGLAVNTRYTLDLSLNIQGTGYGGYVGDLYAYLAHQTPAGSYDMAVLLNRPGRSVLLPAGYDDGGLNITLSDRAAYDIHTYQSQFHELTGDGILVGTWQPDRRLADPDTVVSGDERASATLDDLVNSLVTPDPNGTWYCFIADMETGGTMQLNSWSMTLAAVPEPANALALAGLLASGLLLRTRRRGCQRRRRAQQGREN
ncbi:MAG: PEP-CTERM sorting domain-containing protein [Verrucomicrobia bacterium]|nr:PEP-CTERM sorting domain-containing protein [Verrucomicrobiota bacterium]